MVVTVALAVLAKRLALPSPIVFVVAGVALAFVPGLPDVRLAPEWIFLTVLPPLLFAGGWTTDWAMFRSNLRPILLLAIGLVVVTTVVTALVAERALGMGLAAAFVLGAIVAPPDAVAALATLERFSVPRRIVAVLEGEGLVNDATALVIYGYALAAVTSGAFSLPQALGSFVLVAGGGILVGVVVEWLVERVARALERFDLGDELLDNLVIMAAPYAAYLGADLLHVSPVLATVIAGILLSRRSSVLYGPETRLVGTNVWRTWVFLLNAYVFLGIGLQVRTIVHDDAAALSYVPAGLLVSAVLVAVRMAWVYPATILPRLIPAVRRRDPMPPWSAPAVIGWTGMRGIVSLAAALAIPLDVPGRNAIIVVTFVVIVVTLVGTGLTLPLLLRWLRVRGDGESASREVEVRVAALRAGLGEADAWVHRATTRDERAILARMQDEYSNRIEHLRSHGARQGAGESSASRFDHDLQAATIRAERTEIMRLRDAGEIPDDLFRRVQYDLDLAESRLF